MHSSTGTLVYLPLEDLTDEQAQLLDDSCDVPLTEYCFDAEELSGLMANVADEDQDLANELAEILEKHPDCRYIFVD